MQEVQGAFELVLLIEFALFLGVVYVVWRLFSSLGSIEHALWAIVSQLKALRPAEPLDAVQQSLRERSGEGVKTEVRGGVQRISNSAFGR